MKTWLYFDSATPPALRVKYRRWLTDVEAERQRNEARTSPTHVVLVDAPLIFVFLWRTKLSATEPIILIHKDLLKEGEHE